MLARSHKEAQSNELTSALVVSLVASLNNEAARSCSTLAVVRLLFHVAAAAFRAWSCAWVRYAVSMVVESKMIW